MNGNGQMELHYINTGFPYTVTESFMDFFGGLNHVPIHCSQMGPLQNQETAYWSVNVNSYKFGSSGPWNASYYGFYEVNDNLPRMEFGNRAWEYPSMMNIEEPVAVETQSGGSAAPYMNAIPEECTLTHQDAATSQLLWQDEIDPDSMTYEELLNLGEAVGTQSRGLSQELINLLPTSKYKSGGFFSRKKSGERCVICQMRYKRGDRQIKLPCKHIYHTECGSKWLSINKICPICSTEVFGEESSQ